MELLRIMINFIMFLIVFSLICSSFFRRHIEFVASWTLSKTSIIWNKWMPIFTSFFLTVQGGWANTPKNIYSMSDQNKMVDIHAPSISTKMIKFRSFIFIIRKFAEQHFPKESVGFISFTPIIDTTIAITKRIEIVPALCDWIENYFRVYSTFFSLTKIKHSPIIPAFLANVKPTWPEDHSKWVSPI